MTGTEGESSPEDPEVGVLPRKASAVSELESGGCSGAGKGRLPLSPACITHNCWTPTQDCCPAIFKVRDTSLWGGKQS